MSRAVMVMGGVSALAALAALLIARRPVASAQGIYARRMVATMLGAAALILALFAFGLERAAG